MAATLSYAESCKRHLVPRKVGLQTVPHEAADVVSESASTQGDDFFNGVSSSCSNSPRESWKSSSSRSDDNTSSRVVVKSTFIDIAEGSTLKVCYRRLRKTKTDSALLETHSDDELDVYEPGKFSDKMQAKAQQQSWSQSQQCLQQEVMAGVPQDTKTLTTSTAGACDQNGRTTLMMRNLPNNYTREMLLFMLDGQGFAGCYDFVYLPCDFERSANLGYAFVNLVDSRMVDTFWSTFDGFSQWEFPTAKVCQVRWSGPHQGLEAHIDRYRNSPVMHKSVPDEYKPMIFTDGVRQTFPPPTKRIKSPNRTSGR